MSEGSNIAVLLGVFGLAANNRKIHRTRRIPTRPKIPISCCNDTRRCTEIKRRRLHLRLRL